MSALAVTTPVRVAAPPNRRPDCARPHDARFGAAAGLPAACRVHRPASEPTWELTRRGMAAAMAVVGAVMGSAAVTLVTSFLSVSNAPL